jgi:hypothetical protein
MTCALILLVLPLELAQADTTPPPGDPRVSVNVDLRGRFESDVDSTREDGTRRDDRHRGRVRGRLEVRVRPARSLLVLARLRTGSPFSQQSPHLTIVDFTGGTADRASGLPDRFLVQHSAGPLQSWIGRNEFPFWTQNELFWDRDVTLPGGFVSYRRPIGAMWLHTRAGYFGLPDGAVAIRGRMAAGQVSAGSSLSEHWSWQGAVGLYDMQGAARSRHLLTGDGTRDYRIAIASFQFTRAVDGAAVGTVRLGADLVQNVRAGAGAAAPQGVRSGSGLVLMTIVGGRVRPGAAKAWEIGHTFAHIEKRAINPSYAQDDWVRWGSPTQTSSSDLRGHEASARYWLSRNVDCHARAFLVRSISTLQNGTRFRFDVNWRFEALAR